MLIEPEIYESMKQKQGTVLSDLDKQMQEILNSDMDQIEKLKQYHQVLSKYNFLKKKLDQPKPIPVSVQSSKQPASDNTLLKGIKRKKNARDLLQKVKHNRATDYDEKGQLIFDQQLIEQSDLNKLIAKAVDDKFKNVDLPGWDQLQTIQPKWTKLPWNIMTRLN